MVHVNAQPTSHKKDTAIPHPAEPVISPGEAVRVAEVRTISNDFKPCCGLFCCISQFTTFCCPLQCTCELLGCATGCRCFTGYFNFCDRFACGNCCKSNCCKRKHCCAMPKVGLNFNTPKCCKTPTCCKAPTCCCHDISAACCILTVCPCFSCCIRDGVICSCCVKNGACCRCLPDEFCCGCSFLGFTCPCKAIVANECKCLSTHCICGVVSDVPCILNILGCNLTYSCSCVRGLWNNLGELRAKLADH
jgi:hypothetical protein